MKKWFIVPILGVVLIATACVLLQQAVMPQDKEQVYEDPDFLEITATLDEASDEIMEAIQEEVVEVEETSQISPSGVDEVETESDADVSDVDVIMEQEAPSEEPPRVSIDEILPRYTEGLTVLKDVAERQLDELIDNLVEEYYALTPDERSKIMVKTTLATKYVALAKDLERRIDDIFYHMIGELEAELVDHELPLSVAGDLRDEYEDQKVERQKELLQKAMIASQD